MLAKETKIILSNKSHKNIEEITNEKIKTKYGDDEVIEIITDLNKKTSYKLIFSDGYKVTVTEEQEFLMYQDKLWKQAKDLKEGDLLLTPDDTFIKLVDKTKTSLSSSFNLFTRKGNGYTLSNGLYSR